MNIFKTHLTYFEDFYWENADFRKDFIEWNYLYHLIHYTDWSKLEND